MHIIESQARMDVHTTEPHSTRKNKAETVIRIIKLKPKRIRVKRNTPNRVWEFGMV